MSYTSIVTTKPGPSMQEATTPDEANALLAEVWSVVEKNGGESVLTGSDFARGVNIAITKWPDANASMKTEVELTAKGLLEFLSAGPFMQLEEWWPIWQEAMSDS